jgi:uroporphyrinogen decarboxylase
MFIVYRDAERIVTQASFVENSRRVWQERVNVYYASDPPTWGVDPAMIGLSAVPSHYEPLEGARTVDNGIAGLRRTKELLGDQGVVGVFLTYSSVVGSEEGVYHFADHPEELEKVKADRLAQVERRFADLMAMQTQDRPDFLCVGGSGTLIFQSPAFFREHAFPAVKRAIELATAAGIPTHVHSCGPEKELVRIMAEETELTVIDPLEIPPMGDCNLAELKQAFGDRIVLKGNLHTTNTMLRGTVADVVAASRKAMEDAAAGGRFILSTGDQCGRDTPDENLAAMIETARTYGRY